MNYVQDVALNGNQALDLPTAISYLADTGLNVEEWEWVGAKATMVLRQQATRADLQVAIREMAAGCGMICDDDLVRGVATKLLANQALFEGALRQAILRLPRRPSRAAVTAALRAVVDGWGMSSDADLVAELVPLVLAMQKG